MEVISCPIAKKGVLGIHFQEGSSVGGSDLSPALTEEPVTMAMVTLQSFLGMVW